MTTFAKLGLAPVLVEALTALGYEEPTPVQREAIPPLLEGRDLLGQAWRNEIPSAVATALNVTPAHPTSASSNMSAEHALCPSPPVAG